MIEPFASAQTIVVVAPHPDDDVLGCGGLLREAAMAGARVHILIVTDGAASHPGSREFPPERLRDVREAEARACAARLGIEQAPSFLRWPDGTVPDASEAGSASLFAALRAAIAALDPHVIIGPWCRDPHPDHRAVSTLVRAVVATLPGVHLAEYAVWLPVRGVDGDEPRPRDGRLIEVDVRSHVDAKTLALREHRSQLGQVVFDSPSAFVLPQQLIDRMNDPVERFVMVP